MSPSTALSYLQIDPPEEVLLEHLNQGDWVLRLGTQTFMPEIRIERISRPLPGAQGRDREWAFRTADGTGFFVYDPDGQCTASRLSPAEADRRNVFASMTFGARIII